MSHSIIIKNGQDHAKSMVAPGIMVDPATETAMLNAATDLAIKNEIARKKSDTDKIKAWMIDKTRVTLFNEYHQFPEQGGPMQLIPIEVCCTYPKVKGTIIGDTLTGLTLTQENELRLFAYAKNLLNGVVYTIGDQYVQLSENPEAHDWDKMRTEKPSLAEVYKRPPSKLFGCDMAWAGNRFEINKFNPEHTPQSYYTFLVSKNTLLTILRKIV